MPGDSATSRPTVVRRRAAAAPIPIALTTPSKKQARGRPRVRTGQDPMTKRITKCVPTIIVWLAMLFMFGCHEEHETHHEPSKFAVTTPLRKNVEITAEYVAQVRAIQHIELRALERGYLQGIFVDEGQLVKKGQKMFQIMPLLYQAELEKAAAEAQYAAIEFQNTKILADGKVVSPNELALAKAKMSKANAELSLARVHRSLTEIRAPFDGIMGRFQVRQGSLVDEGELLTTLSDNRTVWVYFNVTESEYLDYKSQARKDEAQPVRLLMANGEIFAHPGKVETIEADFNNETGNIAFRATFPNPDALLRHGETGKVLMSVPLRNALVIPQKATFEVLDKRYVFVVDEQNRVRSREISVVHELPHLYLIDKGLKGTDKILIEGLRKVRDGQEVVVHYQRPDDIIAKLELPVQ
jgi:membrane fusion protein (multidrug efflux system)